IESQQQAETAEAGPADLLILIGPKGPSRTPVVDQKARWRAENLERLHGISAVSARHHATGILPAMRHFPANIRQIKRQSGDDAANQPRKVQSRRFQQK